MADLKSLKLRINSIKKTQKITKAMQMVAASKLRKAREAAEDSRLYTDNLQQIIASQACEGSNLGRSLIYGSETPKNALLVVSSSDRGLCGGLNTNVSKQVISEMKKLESDGLNVNLLFIGGKSFDYLKHNYKDKTIDNREGYSLNKVTYSSAKEIADFLITEFDQEKIDICKIIFSKFNNAISQEPKIISLIPCETGEKISTSNENLQYEYEPSKEELLETIAPKNIAVQLFQCFLEAFASEQGARMTAMDNAVTNCSDLIKKLNLKYNRTRQAKITTELIEIIAASEAI
jgi:F-type H+-transporting ATPase subunit gamma